MFYAFVAAVGVALLSLIGTLLFRHNSHITGTHRFIIPIALGMFLGIVFFELVPETLHTNETGGAIAILGGFLAFYWLSHKLRTYHHHHHDDCHDCVPKSSANLLLIGDAIHNIADGVVIATAFAINPAVGIITTIGVALHEIPQEIAEFGVLIQSGYTKAQAAFYNLLSASSIVLGVVLSFAFLHFGDFLWVLTGIAAGNLLYIAAADMIPELHGEKHRQHFVQTFLSTIIGIALIALLISWTHQSGEHHDEENHEETEGMIIAH